MSVPAPASMAAAVYRGFLDALNGHDLVAVEQFVDVVRYRENCVGCTRGWVDWPDARKSMLQVWQGIPDLKVDVHDALGQDDVVLIRGTVHGTASGRLFGAPATKRRSGASYFD